jgi:hypothetical protein
MNITHETSQLAKEKGFNLLGSGLYRKTTQSQLQDWILEKHGYFVTVELAYNEWGRYSANVEKQAKDGKTAIIALDGFTIFDKPKDALEEGLYETLKLIE